MEDVINRIFLFCFLVSGSEIKGASNEKWTQTTNFCVIYLQTVESFSIYPQEKKGNMNSLTYSFQPSVLSIPSNDNNTQHPVAADPASCYDAVVAPNEGWV